MSKKTSKKHKPAQGGNKKRGLTIGVIVVLIIAVMAAVAVNQESIKIPQPKESAQEIQRQRDIYKPLVRAYVGKVQEALEDHKEALSTFDFPGIDFTNVEFVLDDVYLKNLRSKLSESYEIDHNYRKNINTIGNTYVEKLKAHEQEGYHIADIARYFDEATQLQQQRVNNLDNLHETYVNAYTDFFDLLIKENDNIEVKNNELVFSDEQQFKTHQRFQENARNAEERFRQAQQLFRTQQNDSPFQGFLKKILETSYSQENTYRPLTSSDIEAFREDYGDKVNQEGS